MNDDTKKALEYKCPGCAAPLAFDPTSGKLKCEFCNSLYDPEEIEAKTKEKESSQEAVRTDEEFKSYSCSSCGAELLADQNTAVMQCPYCGNNSVVTAQFAASIRPDYIIPFGVTKDEAVEQYNAYYKKGIRKFLLPGSFSSDSHVQEIQGVYIPFWLFSGNADIDASYQVSNRHKDGDDEIIEHYDVRRSGSMDFEKVPADASRRMDDDLMDSIEPYDFNAFKDFSMTYLPGFLAERFDVDEADDKKRAKDRVTNTMKQKARETVHYDSIDREHADVDVRFEKTDYALLPAWLLTTQWNDKEWTFAMNAQTRKFTGNLPVSVGKFLLLVVLAFAIGFVPCFFLADIKVALIAGAVIALIVGLILHGTMKPVSRASNANDYMAGKINLRRKEDIFVRTERIHHEKENNE